MKFATIALLLGAVSAAKLTSTVDEWTAPESELAEIEEPEE